MQHFFTKRRITWTLIIVGVLFVGWYGLHKKNAATSTIQTDTVKRQHIEQTVLTTGQVVSDTDLSLSFGGSGTVSRVYVKEGDVVKSGALLAILDQKNALASLTSAYGVLAQAQANYQKLLAGASSEQVAVAQAGVGAAQTTLQNAETNLDTVKQQQQVLVQDAYNAMLNSTVALAPGPNNISSVNPTVSGTYTGTETGQYKITIYSSGALSYMVSGLGIGSGQIPPFSGTLIPIGNGLTITFPSGSYHPDDYWTISIPNTQAANYLANYNAYQSALQTQQAAVTAAQAQVSSAQAAVDQAQANLDQQIAAARPVDVAAAKAQIISAEGQVAAARATLSNTVLRAPANGTITQVDVKIGELATAAAPVIHLQDVGDLHAEANVSEANVAALQVGQNVDYTFDALGPDRHFTGTLETINPASTVVSGVVNYKVTAKLPSISDIKPGMTANMTILAASKDNALVVPSSAIISRDSKKYVRVVDNAATKSYHEVEVTTGLEADGGLVEILTGLNEGQEIVTFVK